MAKLLGARRTWNLLSRATPRPQAARRVVWELESRLEPRLEFELIMLLDTWQLPGVTAESLQLHTFTRHPDTG